MSAFEPPERSLFFINPSNKSSLNNSRRKKFIRQLSKNSIRSKSSLNNSSSKKDSVFFGLNYSQKFNQNLNLSQNSNFQSEELDSLISNSLAVGQNRSARQGGGLSMFSNSTVKFSVLENHSKNPLNTIQAQIPYYLIEDTESPILRDLENFEKMKKIVEPKTKSEFFGELKEELAHGFGLKKFKNGDLYLGKFFKGGMNGNGIYYFGFGDVVKGVFGAYGKDGVKSIFGKGIYRWKNGSVFKGMLKNGAPNGRGINWLILRYDNLAEWRQIHGPLQRWP
jgi:hypothetical protein